VSDDFFRRRVGRADTISRAVYARVCLEGGLYLNQLMLPLYRCFQAKPRSAPNLYHLSIVLNRPRNNGVVVGPVEQGGVKAEAGSDEGATPKQKPRPRNGAIPGTPSVTSHPQGISDTLPFLPRSDHYRRHTIPTGEARYLDFCVYSSAHKSVARIPPTW